MRSCPELCSKSRGAAVPIASETREEKKRKKEEDQHLSHKQLATNFNTPYPYWHMTVDFESFSLRPLQVAKPSGNPFAGFAMGAGFGVKNKVNPAVIYA